MGDRRVSEPGALRALNLRLRARKVLLALKLRSRVGSSLERGLDHRYANRIAARTALLTRARSRDV
jgi:hypothetical protein